jgi:hypothetical protein
VASLAGTPSGVRLRVGIGSGGVAPLRRAQPPATRCDASGVRQNRASRSRTEHLEGPVFARRYLLHVLPKGLRAVRHYGYAHPAAKATRERVAFHTGRPLHLPVRPPKPVAPAYPCPCCGEPMAKLPLSLLPLWKTGLSPPRKETCV